MEQDQPTSLGTENEVPPEQPEPRNPSLGGLNLLIWNVCGSNCSHPSLFLCVKKFSVGGLGGVLLVPLIILGGLLGWAAGRWAYARFHNHLTAALVALFAGCASGILLVCSLSVFAAYRMGMPVSLLF